MTYLMMIFENDKARVEAILSHIKISKSCFEII